jgi:uncharacterized protein
VPSQDVDTVLLKTASRCNLNCTYCYVYNMGDDAWRFQPKRMSPAVVDAVVDELGQLSHAQDHPLSVVLHGGEPLLLGSSAMSRLIGDLRKSLRDDAGIHVQTNAVLLSDVFIDLFAEHDVGVSISFDGPVHDANRLDRRGRGSHDRVAEGIARLRSHPAGDRIFSGLLAVVDPSSDPVAVYRALKATGAPGFDFLYRDGNHTTLPFGKSDRTSTEYGEWMIRLADCYIADPDPPRVRILDDLLRLILGGQGQKEGVGLTEYGILVIDTDGTVTKNDTLKAGHGGGDRFGDAYSITERRLQDYLATEDVLTYYELQEPCSNQCRRCPEINVCGGGMPTHRWSEENGYDNPTIFCADQLALIGHLRRVLSTARSPIGGDVPLEPVLGRANA